MIFKFSPAVKSGGEKSFSGPLRPFGAVPNVRGTMISVGRRIRVPEGEIRFRFDRAGGPGGQNVQKTSTKATLRWSVEESGGIPEAVRERFRRRFRRRITRSGEIVISSQRYRDQSRNARDCVDKLRSMLRDVATAPKPRKPTRPGKGVKERRLREKKARSERKRLRKDVSE